MKPATVTVTAAEGRIVPIATSTATAPGGRLLLVNPGDVVELPYTSDVRRSIARGDLELVEAVTKSPSKSSTKNLDTKKEG